MDLCNVTRETIGARLHTANYPRIRPDLLHIINLYIFKQRNRVDQANYWFISGLMFGKVMQKPHFRKLLEKVMYQQLIGPNYVSNMNILHPLQQGYQTWLTVLHSDQASQVIDNNEYSIGVFLDLLNAFDTVDHNIFFKSLKAMI